MVPLSLFLACWGSFLFVSHRIFFGSIKMAESCGFCEDVVNDLEGLWCDRCDKWYHPSCQSVKKRAYKFFAESEQPWLCSPCLKVFKGYLVKATKVDSLEQEVAGLRQRLALLLAKEKSKDQSGVSGNVVDGGEPSLIKMVPQPPTTEAVTLTVPAPAPRTISGSHRPVSASQPIGALRVVKESTFRSKLASGIESRIQGIRREVDGEGGNNVGLGSDRDSGWQVARSKGGSNRKDRPRVLVDIPMDNRFGVLEEGREGKGGDRKARQEASILSSPELVVIGDSQVRHLGGNLGRKSRVACFPGAGVVSREGKVGLEQLLPEIPFDSSSSVVINIGGNDIGRVGSEEIFRAYERVLRDVDRRACNVLVVGILPRPSRAAYWSSVAIGLNVRISALCDRLGLRFVDVWDSFQGRGDLYAVDGVHLNFKGYRAFGRVVDGELDRVDVLMRQGNF